MKHLIILFIILLPSFDTFSQCRTVSSYLFDDVAEIYDDYGYSVRTTYTYGQLREGQSDVFARKFYYGNDYVLSVVGDSDARDIDLYIYDDSGRLVAKESSTNKISLVKFSARYTGTYYIKIRMYDTSGYSAACWTLVYGYN